MQQMNAVSKRDGANDIKSVSLCHALVANEDAFVSHETRFWMRFPRYFALWRGDTIKGPVRVFICVPQLLQC